MTAAAIEMTDITGGQEDTVCMTAEWVSTRTETVAEATPLILVSSLLMSAAPQQGLHSLVPIDIPVPDGPRRQAYLQRFTL